MKHIAYRRNIAENFDELFIEEVAIGEIARAVGTPFYCYSKKTLQENYLDFAQSFSDVDHKICYAIKANYNLHLIKVLAQLQSGIDAVSAGEIDRAIKAGIDCKKIVFAGVGKTEKDIIFAIKSGVEEFSVESEAEMFELNRIALAMGIKVKFSLRVNPNVDAKTHDKISTGRKCDKFGVDIDLAQEIYTKAMKLSGLEIYGVAMHIGSQITSLEPFRLAFEKLRNLCVELRQMGCAIKSLDIGGGIGILYKNETTIFIHDYAQMVKKIFKDLNVKLTIAPGRAIVGSAGLLISEVIYSKRTEGKNFAIIDAAMNDLMRPGLYDSYHEVLPVVKKYGNNDVYDLVGPICETTDVLAKNRNLANLQPKDLLTFCSAGAYGASMSNEYNCRPLIPEVLVDGKQFKIIRKRPSFDEMLRLEEGL